ncbi:MAG: hypothetical protein WCK78_13000 [Paludibacter sp.]
MKTNKLNKLSKEEQVLREIFSNTKMKYINEHFFEFNFGYKSLLTYDDLNNNVTYDIEIIYEEFRNRDINRLLTLDELSETIKKLMKEVFNIDNLNHIYIE